jgi:hypothetical protein
MRHDRVLQFLDFFTFQAALDKSDLNYKTMETNTYFSFDE